MGRASISLDLLYNGEEREEKRLACGVERRAR
jgi:hypothetical protein